MIVGDNSEVGGWYGTPYIHSESTSPLSHAIENILQQAPAAKNIGERLAVDHIQYLMLSRDASNAATYDYLWKQSDLQLFFERPDMVVWRNMALPT